MMKKKFEAFLREKGSLRELMIDGAEKPAVDQAFVGRWQRVFSIIAAQACAPAALILRITKSSISILLESDAVDRNAVEYFIENGLYCESALGESGLLISHAIPNDCQNENPIDIPAITACFGLPVQWPDKALYGAICVLNKPGKALKRTYLDIITELKATIEQELEILHTQHRLQHTSETDALTSIYNRRKIEDILAHEFERAKRYLIPFSVTMIDLNGFKQINDTFGHDVGDDILRAFSKSIGSKIRETDFLGRWGGDEFILICPYTNTIETQQMLTRIKPSVNQDMNAMAAFSDFCFGVSQYQQDDQVYQVIVKRADEIMYQSKSDYKSKAKQFADAHSANL